MILAFHLSMPRVNSWNGRWSGEGKDYVLVQTFRSKEQVRNAMSILQKGHFRYSWPDGWAAAIRVEEVDSKRAASLRKRSAGFCGYDWMVKTIVQYGHPMADHEVAKFLEEKQSASATTLDR